MMTTKSRIAPTTAVGTAIAIVRSRSLSPPVLTPPVVGEAGTPVRKTSIL